MPEPVREAVRAITVCVDYSNILKVTLPYNKHHFSDYMVVTSGSDQATQNLAIQHGCKLHTTGAFYANGALFNKWAALEEALDAYRRDGWLCLLDADIALPQEAQLLPCTRFGYLMSPLRRMAPESCHLVRDGDGNIVGVNGSDESASTSYVNIPSEGSWQAYPLHRNISEHAGYCQMFHADDPLLGPPPWHDVTWVHAGGADSFFQMRWPVTRKVRPAWECLHLGPAGENWAGVGEDNRRQLREMLRKRRSRPAEQRFDGERFGH